MEKPTKTDDGKIVLFRGMRFPVYKLKQYLKSIRKVIFEIRWLEKYYLGYHKIVGKRYLQIAIKDTIYLLS